MGVVCQACGAENHGGVAVCRMCAAALPAAPDSGRERTKSRSRRRASDATASRASRWWLVAGLGVLAVVLFRAWDPTVPDGQPAVAAAPSATAAERPIPAVTDNTGGAADSLAQATAAAEARLQASLERLAREDRERAEAHARERAASERGSQRQADPTRRREQTPTAARAESVQTPQAMAPATTAVAPVQPTVPENRAAASATPAAPLSVEQRCAGSGNYFSRSVCQSQACADPAAAQDPACRRLREIEQASRPDPALLN